MLNTVVLLGRLTADPELRSTQAGTSVVQFTVAVDRNYAKQGEEKQTDFISCVAWKQTAEFISKHFGKGRMVAIEGRLQSRTYDDKNGSKHYITEVIVENVSFTGEPKPQDNYSEYGEPTF
jgi:single-strand DNA-binding protein